MQSSYSGLEVAPSDGLFPKEPNHSELEVRHGSMNEKAVVHEPYGSETIPLHHEEKRSNRHNICGLRKVTFWLTLALVATIIVAIVGGSVGGTLLLRKSQADEVERVGGNVDSPAPTTTDFSNTAPAPTDNDSPTISPTSTTSSTSSAISSGSTGLASMDCVDGRTLASEEGIVYREYCAEGFPAGRDGVHDISKTTKYTFQACMDACDSYNAQRDTSNDPECLAITYDANLTSSIAAYNANCYLKDAQGTGLASENSTSSAAKAH